ncbi:PREDICTED: signal peptide peptidase-like 2B isoform X2 [Priapulus caudatus]|uniref:Signal peptide peptidase-like 2B isoform X2 n=1 Tax=Priapulus caudatus TaxID=37621 RepID=A0ABM1DYA5_PRICU|nr:PREDICTED: signal peptide peptidase-like 2B isoform X2 [Priapulus caudatus]
MAAPTRKFSMSLFSINFIIISLSATQVLGDLALLYSESVENQTNATFCVMYNPNFWAVPALLSDATKSELLDLTPSEGCLPYASSSLENKQVMVSRGNCTFAVKATLVQDAGGAGIIIVSDDGLVTPHGNASEYANINVTVSLITDIDAKDIQAMGPHIQVALYAPSDDSLYIDYSLILIWLLAVGCVITGSYWSGVVKYKKHVAAQSGRDDEREASAFEHDTLDLSPKFIVLFVVLMCGMLMLLYFFYDYLVYVIIALFGLASAMSLFVCLSALLALIPCPFVKQRVMMCGKAVSIKLIVLALLCLGLATWWAVERKTLYSWILQDILGVAFCINMLVTLRLPNLKTCTILLVLLFVYDIFFVFITPLLTKDGQSVMVDVATGGSSRSQEQLPMVIKVPHFSDGSFGICSLSYSLLGFGDILVPGLLISFCHGFDLQTKNRKIYFVSTSIGYGIGLVLTFVSLALMGTGQPALLYLVPCTLLVAVIIGACRRELADLWSGQPDREELVNHADGDQTTPHDDESGSEHGHEE